AGAFSSTIMRCPTATRGRCAPASPFQLAGLNGAGGLDPRPPAAIRTSAAAVARAASGSAWNGSRRGRVRIEPKITGIGDGAFEAGSRGDHRGVVRAEGERRE